MNPIAFIGLVIFVIAFISLLLVVAFEHHEPRGKQGWHRRDPASLTRTQPGPLRTLLPGSTMTTRQGKDWDP